MRRWLAIITIVGVTVGLLAMRRGCGSTRSREHSGSNTYTAGSRSRSGVMSSRNSEPAGSLRLAGRVVGPDGQAVEGAHVWINSLPQRSTTSASNGTFEFEDLLGRTYEVRAQAADLIGGPRVIRVMERSAPVVIKLREGAHILVTVIDATRAPVANATVRAIGTDSLTTTDATGQARVTAHPGWVAIEATGRDYAPRRVSVTSASSGTTARITIVLHKGFELSGHVVDQDRKPIPNARIYARQESGMLTFDDDETEAAVTDEKGAFTIPSLVGMHTIIAIDDEHAPTMTPSFDIDRAITDLEIVMKVGAVYAGNVVDPDGRPAGKAWVYVDTMGSLGQRRFSTTSDASGAFEIRGLPRTMAMAYASSNDGVSDEAIVQLTEQPELRGQTLALKRSGVSTGVIAGVVVDDTGAPVADVLVNVAARRRSPAAAMSSSGVDNSTATSTSTSEGGEFSIPDLPAGEYGIWPGEFDRPPLPAEAAQFVAGQDASSFMTTVTTGDKAVRLVIPRAGGISGKVTFADTGDAVDDFTLDVQPRGDRDGAVPGEHGTFEVRDLRPGTYALRISGRGFLDANKIDVRVDAGKSTEVGTIIVDRGRTLTGKVVDTAGRGVAGAKVMVGHTGVFGGVGRFDEPYLDHPGAITDANGGFSIVGGIQNKALGISQLVVGADHSEYGRSLPVAIPSGNHGPQPITLTLFDCGSIAGKVTQNGKPVGGGATIGAGWPEFGVAQTNEDGEFVMSRLPVGPVALRVHASNEMGRAYHRTIQVEAGKQTDVTIDIPVGTIKLSVEVKSKAGADIAGALLFLFGGAVTFENYAQLSARLFPDSQGLARWEGSESQPAKFERIVPGDYTVCTIPLAWSPNDQKLMKRVHTGDRSSVRVYCAPARVAAAPDEQTLAIEVPSQASLP